MFKLDQPRKDKVGRKELMIKVSGIRAVLLGVMLGQIVTALSAQDRIRGTNTRYEQGDWITYSENRYVTSIEVGRQFTYFGTTGGITRYDHWQNQWEFPFTTSSGLADNHITAIGFDENTAILWAATKTAISYYEQTSGRWTNNFLDENGMPLRDPIVSLGFAKDVVFFESRNGRTYVSQNYGGIIQRTSDRDAAAMRIARWTGKRAPRPDRFPHYFMDNGLTFFLDGYIQDTRLRRADISAVRDDQWFRSWMGSWGFGAFRGNTRTDRLEKLEYGVFNKNATAIALDDDGLWAAGQNRIPNANASTLQPHSAITYWNQVDNTWTYHESQFNANLLTDAVNLIVAHGEFIFFATEFGLNIFDKRNDLWHRLTTFDGLIDDFTYDVAVRENTAYIATENGLNTLNLARLRSDSLRTHAEHFDVKQTHMRRIFDLEFSGNLLWAATEYGIYVCDFSKKEKGFVNDVRAPIGEPVTAVSHYGDEIWFGTTNGVYPFDLKLKKWINTSARNINLGTPIRRIAVDKNAAWVATHNGVYKFNKEAKAWVHYTVFDGLADNRVLDIALDGDYVWFGTPKGVTLFYWNDPHRVD